MEDKKNQAEKMSEENKLSVEINQAYIDNVGGDYATAEDVEEAYCGEFESDEKFAMEQADQLGLIDNDLQWPYTCIDWEQAAKELMFDYFESDGFYFRNI